MEKEFVPYEQALALKELGFDEPCIGFYTQNAYGSTPDQEVQYWSNPIGGNDDYVFVLAPLYSQAMKWFREKYNLKGHIEAVEYLDGTPDTYHWSIFNKCNSGYDQLTYEEAELECLKKLIEIVKNQ